MELLKRNTQESEKLKGVEHQNEQDKLSSISKEYDSGIEDTLMQELGLMTLKNTPEPVILIKQWSMGNESVEHLSIISVNAKERSLGKDRAHDPKAELDVSERASASIGRDDEWSNRESETPRRAEAPKRVNEELTAKPKRKYVKRPLPKTRDDRFGTRSRSRKPDSDSGGAGDSSMVAALSSLLETMSGPRNIDRSQALMGSFWPDHLEELTGAHDYITVHAIIVASILQKTHPKLTVNRGKTTRQIHQNELPPVPKQWKELENHMFGAEFKADCVLELSNLEAREC